MYTTKILAFPVNSFHIYYSYTLQNSTQIGNTKTSLKLTPAVGFQIKDKLLRCWKHVKLTVLWSWPIQYKKLSIENLYNYMKHQPDMLNPFMTENVII